MAHQNPALLGRGVQEPQRNLDVFANGQKRQQAKGLEDKTDFAIAYACQRLIIHLRDLDAIQPLSSFQYYDLRHLTSDLEKMVRENISVLNLATGPVSTKAILDHYAPEKIVGGNAGAPAHYDFRSKYDTTWNCRGGYLYDADTVLREIGGFMRSESGRLKKIS